MTESSVTHATFTVKRDYDASPTRVFAAFADPAIKARWFAGPDEWTTTEYELDFRVGGQEVNSGGPRGGPLHTMHAQYYDIVPERRIVFAYEMQLDQTRLSVSLATVELMAMGSGTRLTFTEQGAFLDGYDDPAGRERGTRDLLDALALELQRSPVSAS